jgi:hypothetical protein
MSTVARSRYVHHRVGPRTWCEDVAPSQPQWEGCQKTGKMCLLDWKNPHNPAAMQAPHQCELGSISSYYVSSLHLFALEPWLMTNARRLTSRRPRTSSTHSSSRKRRSFRWSSRTLVYVFRPNLWSNSELTLLSMTTRAAAVLQAHSVSGYVFAHGRHKLSSERGS